MSQTKSTLIALCALIFTLPSCTKDNSTPPPKSNAGPSDTLTLPADSVVLTGTGTATGGKIVAYLWSQVNGPAPTSIVNPGAASTLVSGFIEGIYTFQLMVTDDNGETGVDTMMVFVKPAPYHILTLQPANNPYEYTTSLLNGTDVTGPTIESIDADAWTTGGLSWTLRGLLKFDLSTSPTTARINSAHLYLYSDPKPLTGDQVNANSGPANSFTIQQISANWSPSTLTWFNQPAATTANQAVLPATSQSMLDLDVDVTAMIASMVSTNANYGFLIKLQTETIYNSRIFVASHNSTYPDKHPKLVINYQ